VVLIALLVLNLLPVSIPIWCDYKFVNTLGSRWCSMFQFQYGAIISKISESFSSNQSRFNSNMVRL